MGSPKGDYGNRLLERQYGDDNDPGGTFDGNYEVNSGFSRPGKEYKQDLENRWGVYENALASGDFDALGIPWEEQQQAIALAQQQAMAGQQAAVSELNRGALAGQGFQAGSLAETAEKLTDRGASAAAQATSKSAALNQQVIEQRIGALRADLMGQRDHNEAQVQAYLDTLLKAAATAIEAIPPLEGMPGGM